MKNVCCKTFHNVLVTQFKTTDKIGDYYKKEYVLDAQNSTFVLKEKRFFCILKHRKCANTNGEYK